MRHIGLTQGIAPVHEASASLKPAATLEGHQLQSRVRILAEFVQPGCTINVGEPTYHRPAAGLAALLNLKWRVIPSTDLERRISRLEQARAQSQDSCSSTPATV